MKNEMDNVFAPDYDAEVKDIVYTSKLEDDKREEKELNAEIERYTNKARLAGIEPCNLVVSDYRFVELKRGNYQSKEMRIPDFVELIAVEAFEGAMTERLYVPKMVISVQTGAFRRAKNLREVQFEDGCLMFEGAEMGECEELRKVVLPENMEEIKDSNFSGCWKLREINMPRELVAIGDEAFIECASIEKLELPEKLQKIGNSAFEGCEGIKELKIPDSVTELGNGILESTPALRRLYLGRGIETGCTEFDIDEKLGVGENCRIYMTQGLKSKLAGDQISHDIKVYK